MTQTTLLAVTLIMLAGVSAPVGHPTTPSPDIAVTPLAASSDIYDCGSNDDCGDEEYCRFDPGECDGDGVCKQRPINCTTDFKPVCGCDGETYMNACEAASAGVAVREAGDCI